MPIVTVSRMYGSGGSQIAERVADTLGWQLLDNDLVDAVASRLGMTPEEVSAREERIPSMGERLAETMSLTSAEWVVPVADTSLPPSEDRIFEVTKRIITEAVGRGPTVLVGRGAQLMLAERADALHVFCYAPREALVRRVMERHQVDAKEAERITDEMNRNREQYVKKHWKRSWMALTNYDVCINTERLGIDGSAKLIVSLVR